MTFRLGYSLWWAILLMGFTAAGCSLGNTDDDTPRVVYVTATPGAVTEAVPTPTPQPSATPMITRAYQPTPNPTRFAISQQTADSHVVQPGDTLYGIALAYNTTLDALLAVNELENPNALSVGQVVQLPELPTEYTPDTKLIPDRRFVRGPGSESFDIDAFVVQQPGYISRVTDTVENRQADGSIVEPTLNGAQIVTRVSREYSIDARLLLTLLEYTAGWLSEPEPPEDLRNKPFAVERDGMYKQLSWVANRLNAGYYGWKYRGWTTLSFSGTERYLYAPGLNAGTVAVQYALSLWLEQPQWRAAVSDANGVYQTYVRYFGEPFVGSQGPVVPPGVTQPTLSLPFGQGETWFFTGGAHGGWGSGSAWAAVDFAPPDERDDGRFCFTSDYWVRAVAPGVIARSDQGAVTLDLDGDGRETTGWVIFYLHLASEDRVQAGTQVEKGDPIGRASCEGGFSTATHLHIARMYNGEWIPADCTDCAPFDARPKFTMANWQVSTIPNQEYQGYLLNGDRRLRAEQGRTSQVNRISW